MRLFIAATTVLSLIGASQALPATNSCQETHQVTTGETCKSIALKYNHSQSDIQQWTKKSNTAFDCDSLKVGDSICVKYGTFDKRGEKNDEPKPKHTTTVKPKPKHTTTVKPKPKHTTTVKKPVPAPSPKAINKDKRGEKNDEPKPKHTTTVKPKPKNTTTVKKPISAPVPAAKEHKDINKRAEAKDARKVTAKKYTTTKKVVPKKTTTKKVVVKKHTTVKKADNKN